MEETRHRAEDRRRGLAALFDEYELKDLFRKYISLLLIIEVLIFLVCWVYQLGLDEVAVTGKPVDIPFPWKTYFLVAFTAPIAVTFLLGLVVAGFNTFVYGHRNQPLLRTKKNDDGTESRLVAAINFCLQLPFLMTLGLVGLLVGVVFHLGTIMEFLSRFGEAAARIIVIALGGVLVAGTIFGIVRMVLQYKLRAKNLEYEYKREVMERLGIAIVDNTIIRSSDALPSGSSAAALPEGEKPSSGDHGGQPQTGG